MIIGRFALGRAVIAVVPSHEYCRYHGTSQRSPVRDGLRVLRVIFGDRFHAQRYRTGAGHHAPAS